MLTDDELKAMERPEGDMWTYHNQALKNPSYQIEGIMDCFREELSYSMPYQNFSTPEPENLTSSELWTKGQWYRTERLLGEIKHLRTQWYEHLKEDREYRTNASKRKTNEYNPF